MNILITGASGMIGQALSAHLLLAGHKVYAMNRKDQQQPFYWEDFGEHRYEVRWDSRIAIDAVIHLAGESLGNQRWSKEQKAAIYDSRIDTTRALVRTLSRLSEKPKVLLSASAIGYYGDTGQKRVDESAPAGHDFLAHLAKDWEEAANAAKAFGIRVVNLRTGIVLSEHSGALPRMVAPFKLGAGGVIGSGQQWMSWVSLEEVVRMIAFLLQHEEVSGAVNLVSPFAVQNQTFVQALGKVLNRPAVVKVPALAVKMLYGEMGELLLLNSTHVWPKRLQDLGFGFQRLDITHALQQILH